MGDRLFEAFAKAVRCTFSKEETAYLTLHLLGSSDTRKRTEALGGPIWQTATPSAPIG